ncbi:GNAT family N-acetyltransferase [Streptomyces sp. NPDC003077]|uniref:GNAT family N-acetyltransferase n=1 Tax=Streptomyces sp. NPDC003077 TaxID=3154443 RepID=UPI0033B263A8
MEETPLKRGSEPMHPVEVQPARPAMAGAISRLIAECVRGSYTGLLEGTAVQRLVAECSLPRIQAETGIPGGAPGWLGWLVATTPDGTVIGAAAGGVPLPGAGEVYRLCVSPQRRGNCVGSLLLAALTEQQREYDAETQAVTLLSEKDPAVGFFRCHGFQGSGTRLTRPLRAIADLSRHPDDRSEAHPMPALECCSGTC